MIKQKLKKLGAVAVTFMLTVSSLAIVAQAAVPKPSTALSLNNPAPRWNYIITIAGDLDINSLGLATVWVHCNSDFNSVTKIKAKCELQRLENRSWKTIKTWTETRDASSVMYEKEAALYKNYSYRLKITASAYSGSTLLESVSETFDYGYYQ